MVLDDFLPFIVPETPGAPDPTVRARLLIVAADFCRRTLAWTELQTPVALVEDEPDYVISKPTDSYAYTVLDVLVNGVRLTSKPLTDIQMLSSNWSTEGSSAPVYFNAAIDRGSIRVFPTPRNLNGEMLQVRAAYVPTLTAVTLPDFLGEQYMDVIASGVKAQLMLMPGVEWTNPKLGSYYEMKFEKGLLDASIEEFYDRVPGSLKVTSRAFGF